MKQNRSIRLFIPQNVPFVQLSGINFDPSRDLEAGGSLLKQSNIFEPVT